MIEKFKNTITQVKTDPTLRSLVFSNIVAVIIGLVQGWGVGEFMLAYWLQSVALGLVNFIRMVNLWKYDTARHSINDELLPKWVKKVYLPEKVFLTGFFLIHYGLFHAGYFMFITTSFMVETGGMFTLVAVVFLSNHVYSYYKKRNNENKNVDFSKVMMRPYNRIIPMHVSIVLGGIFGLALPIFIVLKIGVDLFSHVYKNLTIFKPESILR